MIFMNPFFLSRLLRKRVVSRDKLETKLNVPCLGLPLIYGKITKPFALNIQRKNCTKYTHLTQSGNP